MSVCVCTACVCHMLTYTPVYLSVCRCIVWLSGSSSRRHGIGLALETSERAAGRCRQMATDTGCKTTNAFGKASILSALHDQQQCSFRGLWCCRAVQGFMLSKAICCSAGKKKKDKMILKKKKKKKIAWLLLTA